MALFDIKSKEEFFEKLTILKKHENYTETLRNVLKIFLYIDLPFFNTLCKKYGFSLKYFLPEEMSEEVISNIYNDICNQILSKTNKSIPKDIKYEAIKNYLIKTNAVPPSLIDYHMHILTFLNELDDAKHFENKTNISR